jgi:hypothetical protein
MPVKIKPTPIKQSMYLLIPKNIADFIEINKDTLFSLSIEQSRKICVLKYEFAKS